MSDKKFSEFTLQTDNSNVAFVVGFNGSDNVRISPSNLIGSGFLPTSGGTMTGNLLLQDNIQVQVGTGSDLKLYHNGTDSFIENQTGILKIQSSVVDGDISFLADNGSGTPTEYLRLDGGDTRIKIPDNINMTFGAGGDLQLSHDATDSLIRNYTGDLKITNFADDKDIIFQSDDGSGGVETYFFLDGSTGNTKFPNNKKLVFGDSSDLRLLYDGSDSYVQADGIGHLYIQNKNTDRDIIFQSDNGSGGEATYFFLDGSNSHTNFQLNARWVDNSKAQFGNSGDLEIFHSSGTNIIDSTVGDLIIKVSQDDGDIIFQSDNGSGAIDTYFRLDGGQTRTEFEKGTLHLDNVKALFGDGGDLEIYHDGSNSFISDTGTGDLYVKASNNFFVESLGGASKIIARTGGAVDLYHNGSKKIETTSTGVTVTGDVNLGDSSYLYIGASNDLQLIHDGTDSYIQNTQNSGDLVIQNGGNDKDVIFKCDDGSGGITEYFFLDGSLASGGSVFTVFPDNSSIVLGTGNDLQAKHNGTDTTFDNYTGDLKFQNYADDKDIVFSSDDGSGGLATYMYLDGGNTRVQFNKDARFVDSAKVMLGTSDDLQIYHDGSNSYIKDNGTGVLYIQGSGNVQIEGVNGENMAIFNENGSVQLHYDNVQKFQTTSSGVDVTGRMAINDGNDNVLVGDGAGDALTTGSRNVAIGHEALSGEDETGYAVAIGYQALRAQNAGGNTYNVAIGYNAGESVTTGERNTIMGGLAGDAITTASYNVAVGYEALSSEDTGNQNVAVGYRALKDLDAGANANNVAVGYLAGENVTTGTSNTLIGGLSGDALTTGNNNVSLGYASLSGETAGDRSVAIGNFALQVQNNTTNADVYNTAVGYSAGSAITTGTQNTIIGGVAGDALTTGGSNIAIGVLALSAEDTGSRNVAIGYGSLENQNYDGSAYNVAVGYDSGKQITTGIQNTLLGGLAGDALTTGSANVALGYAALSGEDEHGGNIAIGYRALVVQNAGADAYNIAIGYQAGHTMTTGTQNVLLGGNAGDSLTSGSYNIAIGKNALQAEDAHGRNVAIGHAALEDQNAGVDAYNIAIGYSAGNDITTGTQNTIIGGLAGDALTSGANNVAVGYLALSTEDTNGHNVAIGRKALYNLDAGVDAYNTAVGSSAGESMTTGTQNTIVGSLAGDAITDGDSNIVIGYDSGGVLTEGGQNTLVGDQAAGALTTGDENTYIGRRSGSNATTGSNNLSIGAGSSLSSATVSNEANIFNGSVVARFQGAASAWTFVSDERDKKDIEDLELGLDFIDKLKPRKFKWDLRDSDTDKGKESSGFIAQEIKEVLDETGVDYTGIVDTNNPDQYTVAQANIIPMLVKAIQELKQEIQQLKNK